MAAARGGRNHFPAASGAAVATTKEESELLGVSIAFLETEFLAEIDAKFGAGADPDYNAINKVMLFGPGGKGLGKMCPRDGKPDCSYVDALPKRYTGRATVMLSWAWQYTARTVVGALSRWCRSRGKDPSTVYVWQCALCCNQYRVEARKAKNEWEPFEVFKEVFQRRVRDIGHVLALLAPWDNPLYITRMWCVFEFWMALQVKADIDVVLPAEEEASFQTRLESGGMTEVYQLFEKVRLQNATTTSADDRQNILQLVDPVATNYDDSRSVHFLNVAVVQRLQTWFVQTAASVVESKLDAGRRIPLMQAIFATELLMETSDWSRAMRLLERCKEFAQAAGATNTPSYANLLKNMGVCFRQQGENRKAMEFYTKAETAFQAAGATNTPRYANLLHNMGVCFGEQGENRKEMVFFTKAETAFQAAGATKTPGYAQLLKNMDVGRLKRDAAMVPHTKATWRAHVAAGA